MKHDSIRRFPSTGDVPCTFRIPGVCNGDWSTCVWCHLPIPGSAGMGIKCHDLLGAVGCSACHDVIDRRDPRWQDHDLEMIKRMAMARSLMMLVDAGIVTVR